MRSGGHLGLKLADADAALTWCVFKFSKQQVKQYPDAKTIPGILVARLDAPIYFANVQWIKDRLAKYEARAQDQAHAVGLSLEYVILELSPVTHIDAAGLHTLEELIKSYHGRGIQLVLTNPSSQVG